MKKKIRGVITYLISGNDVLLIYKKKGHGEGWYNGPGGKIEDGELPYQAAIREVEEEVGLLPVNPELCGFIRFYDVKGEDWEVYIFRAYSFKGELRESEEAKPLWFKKSEIPYDRMWEDDKYWLPIILSNGYFFAEFHFDGIRMLEKKVDELSREEFHRKIKEIT